jgi:lipopolysaccharide transport system ATP-binding protein
MSEPVISVRCLSKRFKLGAPAKYRTLRDSLAEAASGGLGRMKRLVSGTATETLPSDHFIWALKDVSLEVTQGEVLGLIGSNGAGKSTLLKILSRITEPTSGVAEIRGRISSLLEVGTGFHTELTGRENVYLNGAILGMKRHEIKSRFDEIVAFAEVEPFIDTPVKHYSSGMSLRLAFAVAAHLEPDVLIVDEVLAVGDARFQRKCLNKMQDVGQHGRTVLFVSHNMAAIARLCQRAVLLETGTVTHDGPAPQVISCYLNNGLLTPAARSWLDPAGAPGGDVARLRSVRVLTDKDRVSDAIDIRGPVRIAMEYDVNQPGFKLVAIFSFSNEEGIAIFTVLDVDSTWRRRPRPVGRYRSTVTIPGNFLAEGRVFVEAGLMTIDPVMEQFFVRDAASFHVFDSIAGDSARGDYGSHISGVVRPLLPWQTELL